jgi:uncharacterized protein (TIGR02246 family)
MFCGATCQAARTICDILVPIHGCGMPQNKTSLAAARRSLRLTNVRLLSAIVLAISLAGGCSAPHKPNLSDEEAAIRRTDADWLAAAASRDINRVLPFWADDATILTPGTPPIVGKEPIRKYVAESFATPGFSIRWKTDKVEVSQSGDLAYTTGTNQISFNGPDGKVLTQDGRSVTIWKKQADGSWKCIVDVMTTAQDASAK